MNFIYNIAKEVNLSKLQNEVKEISFQNAELLQIEIEANKKLIFGFENDLVEGEDQLIIQVIEDHDPVDLLRNMMDRYKQFEKDGIDMFRVIQAEYAIMINLGQISIQDAFHIEVKLADVKSLIITGDWYTGRLKMESIEVDNIFTEQLKFEIISKINEYVALNY